MRQYKYAVCAMLWVVLALILPACGRVMSNGLMQHASPDTSALAFYSYHGEMVTRMFLFDTGAEQEILNKLDAVGATEAEGWSHADITLPIYGLEIGGTDGSTVFAVWSNGFWITPAGDIFTFNFDFAGLEQDVPWAERDTFSALSVLPCARILSQDESGWNPGLLTPAAELLPPGGITMRLEEWTDSAVTVGISNESGGQWSYGDYYGLQVWLDGTWYEIPPVPGNWAFNDIAHLIEDGKTQEKTYYLEMYGDLPAGTYRLVAEGLSVEGTVLA